MADAAITTLMDAMSYLSVVTDRKALIELCNETDGTLANSQVYMNSGYCEIPLIPVVKAGQRGICGFGKYSSEAEGPYGVFTYDIVLNKVAVCRLAVMFSVPFDRSVYVNYYALGIFDLDVVCDAALLKRMYYGDQQSFRRRAANGAEISLTDKGYTIKGTMSQSAGAYIIIHLVKD